MKSKAQFIVPFVLLILISVSIAVTYYTKIILQDYDIIYTENGLPELDDE